MRKNLPYFFVYLLYWLANAILMPYLGVFYEQRGLTDAQIGLVAALNAAVVFLAAALIGTRADKSRRPRLVMVGLHLATIMAVGLVYLGYSFPALLCAVLVLGFFAEPINPVTDKLLLDNLGEHSGYYGRFRLGGSIGYALGSLVAGGLLLAFKLDILFVVFVVVMLFSAGCCLLLPVAPRHPEPEPEKGPAGKNFLLQLVKNRAFVFIYVSLTVYGLCEAGLGQFLAIHTVRVGYGASAAGWLIAVTMVGEVATFFAMPALSRHLGDRQMVVLSFLLLGARLLSIGLLAWLPLWLVVLFQIIGGCAYAMCYSAITRLVAVSYPPSIGHRAQTFKAVALCTGAALGALVYGAMYQLASSTAAYLLSAATTVTYGLTMVLYARAGKKNA